MLFRFASVIEHKIGMLGEVARKRKPTLGVSRCAAVCAVLLAELRS
jgi:hypothetical protein